MTIVLFTLFHLWIPVVLAVYLGFISRWHGGGFFYGPKLIKNILWGMPFGLSAGYFFLIYRWPAVELVWFLTEKFGKNIQLYQNALWAVPLTVCLLVWVLSSLAKATGHGGGMDLGTHPAEPGNGRDPEKLEYLILWLHGRIPQYTYDAILMAVVGLFAVLPAALALGYIFWPAGLAIALGGLSKAPAYMYGWKKYYPIDINGPVDFREPTQIGELLTGIYAGWALGWAYITVLIWVFTNA